MKKFILSLFVGLIGLINFGYCEDVPGDDFISVIMNNGHNYSYQRLYKNTYHDETVNYVFSENYDFYCLRHYDGLIYMSPNDLSINSDDWEGVGINAFTCITPGSYYFYGGAGLRIYAFKQGEGIMPGELTQGECQVKYNLIPIEYVDQHYCETNDLCPEQNECTGSGGNLTGLDWSALFINNIQHPGKSIINVNIPDYIAWDYSTNEEEFNLYVGSGYDQDYINSIIDINSYRPDTGDFTNIFVSGLTLIFPYIVITLFIIFVWKLLKRIFK